MSYNEFVHSDGTMDIDALGKKNSSDEVKEILLISINDNLARIATVMEERLEREMEE